MSAPHLNWSTAEVHDAELSVPLEGDAPKGWKQSFRATVRLLGHGEWGEVKIKKHTVRVSHVVPGSEEKLRHYLESVIEQANTSRPEEEDEPEDTSESADSADEGDADGPDARMTSEFRSFAER